MTKASYYRPLIVETAQGHKLDPNLVEAVVWQESSYSTNAYRFEPEFWRRYLADKDKYRNALPERVSASYGLMQVMYPVALENGYEGEPEGLFDPETGLEIGCRHLAGRLHWAEVFKPQLANPANAKLLPRYATVVVRSALAAYNGGTVGNAPDAMPDRNHAYADAVIKKLETILYREGLAA